MTVLTKLLEAVAAERAARVRADQLHAREHAPGFDLFALIAPGETQLSRLFAWILDPNETHGQGTAFLEAFVNHFWSTAAIPGDSLQQARVSTEASCMAAGNEQRRIDILVQSHSWTIAIENKPWAGWQWRQLHAYWTELSQRPGQHRLLALIGGTQDAPHALDEHWRADWNGPMEAVPPRDERVCGFDFGQVAKWIDTCAMATRPAPVRYFLCDLASYCRNVQTGGTSTMAEARSIAAEITSSGTDSIQSAFDIEAAMDEVRAALVADVTDRVRGTLSEPEWKVDGDLVSRFGSRPGLVLKHTGCPAPLAICLFQTSGGKYSWVGFPWGWDQIDLPAQARGWKSERDRWAAWQHVSKLLTPAADRLDQALEAKDSGEIAVAVVALARELLGQP